MRGVGSNILLGGDGKDFIVTWDDISTIFGGAGLPQGYTGEKW
jgi:hypothetical protein